MIKGLKPCPECGSKAAVIYHENTNGYYAACDNEDCYAHTAVVGSAIGAADEWNNGAVFTTWYKRAE